MSYHCCKFVDLYCSLTLWLLIVYYITVIPAEIIATKSVTDKGIVHKLLSHICEGFRIYSKALLVFLLSALVQKKVVYTHVKCISFYWHTSDSRSEYVLGQWSSVCHHSSSMVNFNVGMFSETVQLQPQSSDLAHGYFVARPF